MPTDPARRLVEEVLEAFESSRACTLHPVASTVVAVRSAPKLARMLKVALDALEPISESHSFDEYGNTTNDECGSAARVALAGINRIAEE